MSNVVIQNIIPSDGNPEGIVDAPKGALFYKFDGLYKINYGGMESSTWQNVYFQPYIVSPIFLTDLDLSRVPTASLGAYVYSKESDYKSLGWKFLSNLPIFIQNENFGVEVPTPTPTPVPE